MVVNYDSTYKLTSSKITLLNDGLVVITVNNNMLNPKAIKSIRVWIKLTNCKYLFIPIQSNKHAVYWIVWKGININAQVFCTIVIINVFYCGPVWLFVDQKGRKIELKAIIIFFVLKICVHIRDRLNRVVFFFI